MRLDIIQPHRSGLSFDEISFKSRLEEIGARGCEVFVNHERLLGDLLAHDEGDDWLRNPVQKVSSLVSFDCQAEDQLTRAEASAPSWESCHNDPEYLSLIECA